MQILLAQPSRPTSVDAQHGGFSTRGPSADHDQSPHRSSAQQQRSSSEALGAMRTAASDEALPLQHLQAPAFLHEGAHRQEPGLADIPELASSKFSNDRYATPHDVCIISLASYDFGCIRCMSLRILERCSLAEPSNWCTLWL